MTTDPFAACIGTDMDCISDDIRCRADRAGATIHDIKVGQKHVRVLAHSEASAQTAAVDHCYQAARTDDDLDLGQ